MVADRLDAGPAGLGLLLGAMGGGALAGAWLLERLHGGGLPRHRALPIATVTFSAGMAVVAVTPWLWLGLLGMAFSGRLLDLDVRRDQHGDPAAGAAAAARPDARPLPALGHRPDRRRARRSPARSPRAPASRPTLAGCAALLAAWGLWSLRNPVAAIDGQALGEPRRSRRTRRRAPRRRPRRSDPRRAPRGCWVARPARARAPAPAPPCPRHGHRAVGASRAPAAPAGGRGRRRAAGRGRGSPPPPRARPAARRKRPAAPAARAQQPQRPRRRARA